MVLSIVFTESRYLPIHPCLEPIVLFEMQCRTLIAFVVSCRTQIYQMARGIRLTRFRFEVTLSVSAAPVPDSSKGLHILDRDSNKGLHILDRTPELADLEVARAPEPEPGCKITPRATSSAHTSPASPHSSPFLVRPYPHSQAPAFIRVRISPPTRRFPRSQTSHPVAALEDFTRAAISRADTRTSTFTYPSRLPLDGPDEVEGFYSLCPDALEPFPRAVMYPYFAIASSRCCIP
ncbi:hypothetical protein DFH09DRAFT_1377540, partial [Mycena vulgaris]